MSKRASSSTRRLTDVRQRGVFVFRTIAFQSSFGISKSARYQLPQSDSEAHRRFTVPRVTFYKLERFTLSFLDLFRGRLPPSRARPWQSGETERRRRSSGIPAP